MKTVVQHNNTYYTHFVAIRGKRALRHGPQHCTDYITDTISSWQ